MNSIKNFLKTTFGILNLPKIFVFYLGLKKSQERRGVRYEWRFVDDPQEIERLVSGTDANHPVHDHDFTIARLVGGSPGKYLAFLEVDRVKYLVKFVKHGRQILILNNYQTLPENAMEALVARMIKKFRVVNILTQRNYNNYGFFPKKKVDEQGFVVNFGKTFEDYFSNLGKKTRFNTGYYERRLRKDFPDLKIEFVGQDQLDKRIFGEFIKLVGKRYDESYWRGFLKEDIFSKFRKNVVCTIVRINGVIAAVNIFFVYNEAIIFTGNTFDEAYSDYSLGFLTTFWSIRNAFDCRYKRVILGPGDYGYKGRLANAKEVVYEYSLA